MHAIVRAATPAANVTASVASDDAATRHDDAAIGPDEARRHDDAATTHDEARRHDAAKQHDEATTHDAVRLDDEARPVDAANGSGSALRQPWWQRGRAVMWRAELCAARRPSARGVRRVATCVPRSSAA